MPCCSRTSGPPPHVIRATWASRPPICRRWSRCCLRWPRPVASAPGLRNFSPNPRPKTRISSAWKCLACAPATIPTRRPSWACACRWTLKPPNSCPNAGRISRAGIRCTWWRAWAHGADTVPGSEDERLHALLDTFLDEILNEQPQSATQWGLDSGARVALRSRLDDYSSQAPTRWLASSGSRLERLRRIDRARLSANARVDRDVVQWWLDKVVAGTRRFPFGEVTVVTCSPYVFSQLSGPYQSVPDFLDSQHPVRTVDDAA